MTRELATTAPTIRRSPQVLRALLALRQLILTGEWPLNQRLSEPQLATRVGVSRTPLRLAMEILEHEGLVQRRPRGGFVLRSFTLADIEEAVSLRGILEGTVARWIAERPVPPDLSQLESALYEMDGLLNRELTVDIVTRYVAANERFHDGLLAFGGPLVRRLIKQVVSVPFASPNTFFLAHVSSPEARKVLMTAQEQHNAIIEALKRREGTRVEALAREHARLVLRFLDSATRDREAFRKLPGAVLIAFPGSAPPLEPSLSRAQPASTAPAGVARRRRRTK